MRLLVALAPKLDEAGLEELEQAILAGPPRDMFRDDIEPERWTRLQHKEIWLRLAKIAQIGTILSAAGNERLAEFSAQYPEWQLAEDDRDEFPHWMDDGGEGRKFVATPRGRRALIEWLREHPNTDHWQKDDWRERCRDNFATTACALCALAEEEAWPADRWRGALQAWSEENLVKRSWRYMAAVLSDMPDEIFQTLTHDVSWWLQAIAKTFEGQEATFFELCDRVLAQDFEGYDVSGGGSVHAINHPVGHVTDALLRWWQRETLEDGQGLLGELRSRFTKLCNTRVRKFRHSRLFLAAHVVTLFRVDRDWTTQHLLPLFNWGRSEIEATSAWEGFLWSPRLYRPLMEALKQPFLDTAQHFQTLGGHREQYSSLLTFAALDPSDVFTKRELAAATSSLPQEGLDDSAKQLARTLEAAGDQRPDFWANRVVPYLRAIWPKTQDCASTSISESFGRLCLEAQNSFPEALELLRPWLQTVTTPYYLVHKLHETGICEQYPEQALEFLHIVIDMTQWPPSDLGACLDAIRLAEPAVETGSRYVDLKTYLRQHGRN